MIKSVKELDACPDCASSNIIIKEDKNQLICKDCGLIYEPMAPKLEEKFEKSHGM
jgi:transcription initiation factor TFIIIB Brf1 subunit/transcription initiation factor TFIIB|tara:strand:- start:316 stop:480 length:165 start_codon:yes stop_codon:yes gene_type:complete